MSLLHDEIESALESLESDLGSESVTFNLVGSSDTVDVPCVPGSLTDASIVGYGAQVDNPTMLLNVRTGHFLTADNTEITVDSDLFTADNSTARPRVGKTCVFRGKTMRILTVAEDATGAYLKVFLGGAH